MKFSYSWLSDYVKSMPEPKKLAELFTLRAYQVESIEKKGSDTVFDIELLPNRFADLAGHMGIAHEIHAIYGSQFLFPKPNARRSKTPIKEYVRAAVENGTAWRYTLSYVEGVSVKPSPKKIQERLTACGLRPINSLVDATNYFMLDTGNPAHAFDYDKIEGKTISVRRARPSETMETIDGAVINLMKNDVVIADARGPIALAGIKGGKRAEITKDTKRALIELGVFDPARVRETARRVGFTTDASMRFSHLLPARVLGSTVELLIGYIQNFAGGIAAKDSVDIHKPFPKIIPILLDVPYASHLLGAVLSEKEILTILKRMGCSTVKGKARTLMVAPPPWREDLKSSEDLIEDIGRIYGIERIEARPPRAPMISSGHDELHIFSDQLRGYMKELGYAEAINYALVSEDDLASIGEARSTLKLANPLSKEYAVFRTSMFPGLLKNIKIGTLYEHSPRLFEVGRVFRPARNTPEEHMMLACILSGTKKSGGLYYEAKGTLEALVEECGLDDIWFREVDPKASVWPFTLLGTMHPHRSAQVEIGTKRVGYLFEVHPDFRAREPVVFFELSIPNILGDISQKREFRAIPRFPAMVRDLSVLVHKDERADSVIDVIENSGGQLLADVDLFDYYEGSGFGEDRKSLAFHLVFQSSERTLKDKEVLDRIVVIKRALGERGWEVRE